jgi:peroxiredoxin
MTTHDYSQLPDGLPVPTDDGAARHLTGMTVPRIVLATSDGGTVDIGDPGAGRIVVYVYPLTGSPDTDLPAGWDDIPGARGCTTEACDFRDHFAELRDASAETVWGLSSQNSPYQAEVVERLHLPFSMISDPTFTLADALDLPTFSAEGHPRLYTRLTFIIRNGRVEHVFYPIFPPNTHAQQVLDWLRANPVA